MCEAGEAGESFGRDEFSFASELHAADEGREVDIAAALAGSEDRALHLSGAGKNGRSAIGNSETSVGVTVKSEFDSGVGADEAADGLGDFFRACAAGGVANNESAYFLPDALCR
jgi:hypothetical protein